MSRCRRHVIVVGKGNAALCAALSAQENGAKVLMLEAASEDESGGNSRFAGGVMRFAYESVDDLKRVTELTDEEIANSDFGTNTREEFFDDLYRLTSYRTDADLSEILVTQSLDTMAWLRSKGARFVPNYGRQSGMVGGKRKFFGRMPIEVSGGGAGLVQYLDAAAKKAGIEVRYDTRVASLIYDGERVSGVRAQEKGKPVELRAKSVVLACGGFEANPEWRTRYLGPGWELAKVRGTRFNVGDGLRMALDIGAAPLRQLVGLPRDRLGPLRAGIRRRQRRRPVPEAQLHLRPPDQRRRQALRRRRLGLPFLHLRQIRRRGAEAARPVRVAGVRFQGVKAAALRIPHQVHDQGQREHAGGTRAQARRREPRGLPQDRARIQRRGAQRRAVRPHREGRQGHGRHRAAEIELGAGARHAAVRRLRDDVRHHIHFRGLRIDRETGQVLNVHFHKIPGLYCAGEMVGGLFYFNYPSGTGLVSGAVFGRIAGRRPA